MFTTPRMRLTAVVTAPEISCHAPTTIGIATCMVAPTAWIAGTRAAERTCTIVTMWGRICGSSSATIGPSWTMSSWMTGMRAWMIGRRAAPSCSMMGVRIGTSCVEDRGQPLDQLSHERGHCGEQLTHDGGDGAEGLPEGGHGGGKGLDGGQDPLEEGHQAALEGGVLEGRGDALEASLNDLPDQRQDRG